MENKLILLVDDEPEILNLYGMALNNAGLTHIAASNGLEAINMTKAQHPELVLLDLKMPVMDGTEAFAKIKSDPEIQNTKIVFLTAFSDPRGVEIDEKFAKEAGAIDFIRKGIGLDEFIDKVKEYLAK